jgi:ankyrin repeat protein
VRRLLAAGADVTRADTGGLTVLLGTAQAGHAEVARLLLEACAAASETKSDSSWTALHMAAQAGCVATAQHMAAAPGIELDARDCNNQVLLDCSQMLWALIAGGDCPACLSLGAAVLQLSPHTAVPQPPTCLLNNLHPLLPGCRRRSIWLARCNAGGVAGVLLTAGAAVDAADNHDHTPLLYAAEKGSGRIVQSKLAAGAEMEAQVGPCKWTPLHDAAREGAVGPIARLVGAGADLHAVASNGCRPLHLAAGTQCLEAARLLIWLGASPSLKGSRMSSLKAAAAGSASAASALPGRRLLQPPC